MPDGVLKNLFQYCPLGRACKARGVRIRRFQKITGKITAAGLLVVLLIAAPRAVLAGIDQQYYKQAGCSYFSGYFWKSADPTAARGTRAPKPTVL